MLAILNVSTGQFRRSDGQGPTDLKRHRKRSRRPLEKRLAALAEIAREMGRPVAA